MTEVSIIGVDLAKNVFQLHGARADRTVAFRKKVNLARFLNFLAQQPRYVVATEARATAHSWGCQIAELGRGGSVDLDRFRAFSKWFSASVTPLPSRGLDG